MESIQADIQAILANAPALADCNIILEASGDVDSMVERALGTTKQRAGGKRGLAIIILMPEAEAADVNLPGPPLTYRIEVQTLEHVKINRSAAGTGIRSSEAALAVLDALHHYVTGTGTFHAAANAIQPLPAQAGLVSHVVAMLCHYQAPTGPGKVAALNAAWIEDDTLQLQCATLESSIYFTTDGTFPTPSNGTLYTGPVAGLAVGTTVRAAAYKTGLNPGDAIELQVVDSADPNAIVWDRFTPDWEDL